LKHNERLDDRLKAHRWTYTPEAVVGQTGSNCGVHVIASSIAILNNEALPEHISATALRLQYAEEISAAAWASWLSLDDQAHSYDTIDREVLIGEADG